MFAPARGGITSRCSGPRGRRGPRDSKGGLPPAQPLNVGPLAGAGHGVCSECSLPGRINRSGRRRASRAGTLDAVGRGPRVTRPLAGAGYRLERRRLDHRVPSERLGYSGAHPCRPLPILEAQGCALPTERGIREAAVHLQLWGRPNATRSREWSVIVWRPVGATGRSIGAGICPHATKILTSHSRGGRSPANKPLERPGMNRWDERHRGSAGRSAPERWAPR